MKKDLAIDMFTVLANTSNPAYTFTALGSEKVGDVNAQIVEVATGGTSMKWWIDPATGRLLRKSSQARGPQPDENVTDYREWKTFGGLNLPSKSVTLRNGEQVATMEVTSVELNPTVDKSIYTKPAGK
jgi:hypothetical protein